MAVRIRPSCSEPVQIRDAYPGNDPSKSQAEETNDPNISYVNPDCFVLGNNQACAPVVVYNCPPGTYLSQLPKGASFEIYHRHPTDAEMVRQAMNAKKLVI